MGKNSEKVIKKSEFKIVLQNSKELDEEDEKENIN